MIDDNLEEEAQSRRRFEEEFWVMVQQYYQDIVAECGTSRARLSAALREARSRVVIEDEERHIVIDNIAYQYLRPRR